MAVPGRIFSFEGRITRRQFWLGHLIIFSSAILAGIAGGVVLGMLSVFFESQAIAFWGPAALAVLVTLGALTAEFSLTVRRMRDREGSPWWIGALASLAFLGDLLAGFNAAANGESMVTPVTVMLTIVTLCLSGWIIFELGVMGTARDGDRFGSRPAALARRFMAALLPGQTSARSAAAPLHGAGQDPLRAERP